MHTFTNMKLFPVITDVTFKAVRKLKDGRKCYLCSSVLYFSEIRKHALVFQGILGGTSEMYFHQYFLAFFSAYQIDFSNENNFLGMIMDFSSAQRNGFLLAYRQYTFGRDDGLKYLKGCYMHWMQSVQRVSSNGNAVPRDERQNFLKLANTIRTTTDKQEFITTRNKIIQRFPILRKWLTWWLNPSISSMIFNYNSSMKTTLKSHISRTSNAIEAYHHVLYGIILEDAPLATSLRQILQTTQSDQRDLIQFYNYGGLRPSYDRKPPKIRTRRLNNYVNDARAPDSTKTLFANKDKTLKKTEKNKACIEELPAVTKADFVSCTDMICILQSDVDPLCNYEETDLEPLKTGDPVIEKEMERFEGSKSTYLQVKRHDL
ncbi:hypothetical protein BDA99DRAFT_284548 [Phascolomyces articulosus]|uniref:Uncharacterized protein n=1 Tax=Phascolomyces articulosus TaxID=60185 RepID=A0AAD5PJM0_9FUNG|nr:hypothetical protein BDA99DRAFT_284548 [Phascolomyces articulosus]